MSKLWFLAARQAIFPGLIVASFLLGFLYLKMGNVNLMRGAIGVVAIYLGFVALERLDLQRQHRGS